ncbi:MAG: TonB-dependent receptor [Ferruginibacter sp.]
MILMLGIVSPAFSQVTEKKDTALAVIADTTVDEIKENALDNIPVVSLDENDNQDGSAQNISSQMNAGRNPFVNAATFNFSAVRFRIRGYDADLFTTYMNGAPMENLDNGFTPYGLWGGLNDVLRNRQSTNGLQAAKYGAGDIGGTSYIDSRAFRQRRQTTINYAVANRNYTNRVYITHSTGMSKKGWAFSISGSRRWAEEGFTDGTYYDGWSLYTGLDRKFNKRHMLSLVVFATPTENGRQGSSVQEMLDIAGTNFYNPYWGYQNGKKRNSSIARTFQPMGILTHEWKINDKTTLTTSASYMFGNRSTTGLDWFNAPDPRPDYYRYLPSYETDPVRKQMILDALKNDVNRRQINWDALYNANYTNTETIHDANGIVGNNVSGHRAVYILEERVTHTNKYNFNTVLNTSINSHIDLSAGLSYENQRNNYYKKVNDLLGGEFYVDINQFAQRDFGNDPIAAQNDVNRPNRILYKGDRFGYDYDINIQKTSEWVQTDVKLKNLQFFVSGEHSYTNFYRVGNVKNGLFPNNSYGKSTEQKFYNYSFKAGITYKLFRGNYIFANAGYVTKAPFFENAYIAPRTRDFVQDNLQSEQIKTAEAGYILIAPTVKLRLTGYYTQFRNQVNVLTFYNDEVRNFVNYAVSGIGKTHFGGEFGAEVILYKGLTLNAAAAVGRYRYDTRQRATVTIDNSAQVVSKDNVIYSENFYVPTPQEAYTVGLNYRSKKFWFLSVNFNYFDQMYLDFNPLRRTYTAVEGLDQNSAQYHSIIDQTKLKAQYTLDASAGYSWLMNNRFHGLKKRTFLLLNVGVNNILNNTNIVSGGFEQLRFDFQNKDVNKFPNKQFYAYGLNYFASIGLRF